MMVRSLLQGKMVREGFSGRRSIVFEGNDLAVQAQSRKVKWSGKR